jgi:hypothetical protein
MDPRMIQVPGQQNITTKEICLLVATGENERGVDSILNEEDPFLPNQKSITGYQPSSIDGARASVRLGNELVR